MSLMTSMGLPAWRNLCIYVWVDMALTQVSAVIRPPCERGIIYQGNVILSMRFCDCHASAVLQSQEGDMAFSITIRKYIVVTPPLPTTCRSKYTDEVSFVLSPPASMFTVSE